MTHQRAEWITEFLDALGPVSASDLKIDEALAIKERNLPQRIFRYRPPTKYSWDNLRGDTAWMGAAHLFNDPFDSAFTVDLAPMMAAVSKLTVERIIGDGRFPWLTASIAAQIRAAADPFDHLMELVAAEGGEITQAVRDNARVVGKIAADRMQKYRDIDLAGHHQRGMFLCCFSEEPSSLVMWSHYAAQHTGICVEYDVGALPIGDPVRRMLYPVIYESRPFRRLPLPGRGGEGHEEV